MPSKASRLTMTAGICSLLLVSACHQVQESAPVRVRNPLTGDIMTCGPFRIDPDDKDAVVKQENACKEQAKRLGYN